MWSKNLMINSNKNIDYLICINASPYEINKYNERKKIVARNAKFFNSNVIYLNHVGCQDDLIFDGGTFVMNKKAEIKCADDDTECQIEKAEKFDLRDSLKS